MKKLHLSRGSNQYRRRYKGLKPETWISILFISSVAFFLLGAIFFIKALKAPTVIVKIEGVKPTTIERAPLDMSRVFAPDEAYGLDEIAYRISILESSAGTNDNPEALHNICRSQNKENLWGYGGMQSMICFDSYEEGKERVKRWFAEHMEQMSLRTALCRYANGGYPENCSYAEKFYAIAL